VRLGQKRRRFSRTRRCGRFWARAEAARAVQVGLGGGPTRGLRRARRRCARPRARAPPRARAATASTSASTSAGCSLVNMKIRSAPRRAGASNFHIYDPLYRVFNGVHQQSVFGLSSCWLWFCSFLGLFYAVSSSPHDFVFTASDVERETVTAPRGLVWTCTSASASDEADDDSDDERDGGRGCRCRTVARGSVLPAVDGWTRGWTRGWSWTCGHFQCRVYEQQSPPCRSLL
jgi:hypothetical protein